jgi:hypothetical protein
MTTESNTRAAENLVEQTTGILETHEQVAALVAELDLAAFRNHVEVEAGSNSPVSFESMIRAHLLREIRGMQFMSDLPEYLEDNPGHARALGFADKEDAVNVPSRSTFSRWWNDYLAGDAAEIVEDVATRTVDQAHQQGTPLDSQALEPEDKQDTSERTKRRHKRVKKRELAREMRERVYPHLDLDRDGSVEHPERIFFDLLTHMGLEEDFAENGSETFELNGFDDDETPDADTLLYHLKQSDRATITAMFEAANEFLFELVKRQIELDRPVDVAIDTTDWPFYGDPETEMVNGTKPTKNTHRAYQFATLCVVEGESRFTLCVLPVSAEMDIAEIVRQLIEQANELVSIRRAYLDGGFYGVQTVNTLEDLGVEYIIKAQKSPKTKKLEEEATDGVAVKRDDVMEESYAPYDKATTNLFIVPHRSEEDEITAFITNMDVTEENAEALAELFRRRWAVENSYRVIKSFLPKTTSKDYRVRLFYFLFAVLLYNAWELTNLLLVEIVGPEPDGRPVVTAKYFMTVVARAMAGIG